MQFDPLLDDFDKGKYEFRENHIFIRCHVCLILCNVCPPFIRFLSMYAIRNTESALTNMCVSVCVCAFVCVCVYVCALKYCALKTYGRVEIIPTWYYSEVKVPFIPCYLTSVKRTPIIQ